MSSPKEINPWLSREDFQATIDQLSAQDPLENSVRKFLNTLGKLREVEALALLEHHPAESPSFFATTIFADFTRKSELSSAISAIRTADLTFVQELHPRTHHVYFRDTGNYPLNEITAANLQRAWQQKHRAELLGFFIFKS